MPKHKDYYLRVKSAACLVQKKLASQSGALLNYRVAAAATTANNGNNINAILPTNDYLRQIGVKEKNASVLRMCLREKNQNSINISNNVIAQNSKK